MVSGTVHEFASLVSRSCWATSNDGFSVGLVAAAADGADGVGAESAACDAGIVAAAQPHSAAPARRSRSERIITAGALMNGLDRERTGPIGDGTGQRGQTC